MGEGGFDAKGWLGGDWFGDEEFLLGCLSKKCRVGQLKFYGPEAFIKIQNNDAIFSLLLVLILPSWYKERMKSFRFPVSQDRQEDL